MREWIALERGEGRAADLSLYARALHAQLHRWVDGDGRVPAVLTGDDLFADMAASIAFRFGATRGDRRLIAGHLRELAEVGAVALSGDGLELRALADGAELVRHKLALGDRESATRRVGSKSSGVPRSVTKRHDRSRSSNEASRSETKDDASARNETTQLSRREETTGDERASLSLRASDSPEPVSVDVEPAPQPVSERPWYLDPWSVVNRLTERSKGKIRLAVIGHERELSRALGGAAKAYPDLGAVIDRWADLASRDEATWWRGQWTMGALLGKPDEQGIRSADALALCLAESYARLPKATTGEVKRLDSKATVALAATSAFGRTIQNAGERRQ